MVAGLLVFVRPLARLLVDTLLLRLTVVPGFTVRTAVREAPAAGAVRAITVRFCTEAEGVDTRPRAPDA